jgi:hypothetical protein
MISTNKPLGFSIARQGKRRGLLVAYWCAILACLCILMGGFIRGGLAAQMAFNALIWLPILLGGVVSGGLVKPFNGIHFTSLQESGKVQTLLHPAPLSSIEEDALLDERESRVRDRVHFISYTAARWLALALLCVYGLLGAFEAAWLSRVGPLLFYLLVLTLWSLPQTLILWNEPDVEEAG